MVSGARKSLFQALGILALVALLLQTQACSLSDSTVESLQDPNSLQDQAYDPLDDAAGPPPEPPIATDEPAPPLEGEFIHAQAVDEAGHTLVIGEEGFATGDITEICIQNLTDATAAQCFPVQEAGGEKVFRAVVSDAHVGDLLAIWGENSEIYLPGGADINAIEERVLAWWRKYPTRVADMVLSKQGLLLAGEDGLYIIKSEDLEKAPEEMPSPVRISKGLEPFILKDILLASDGKIWIASEFGLHLITSIDLNSHTAEINTFTSAHGLGSERTNCVDEDSMGRVWVCTNEGLSLLRDLEAEDPSQIFQNFGQTTMGGRFDSGLPARSVLDVEVDVNGEIWVATLNGLARVDQFHPDQDTVFFQSYDVESGLNIWSVYQLKAIRDGGLWIRGASALGYLLDLDPTTGIAQFLTFEEGNDDLPSLANSKMFLDGREGLWLLNGDQLARVDSIDTASPQIQLTLFSDIPHLNTMTIDGTTPRWFYGEKLYRNRVENAFLDLVAFESNEGLPNNRISDFVEDAQGNLWIGTSDGLAILPVEHEVGDRLDLIQILEEDGLIHPSIRDLEVGPDGHVWMGTGDGLMRARNFDPVGKSVVLEEIPIDRSLFEIPEASPLGDEIVIGKILVDSFGDVWMATLYGVLHLSNFDSELLSGSYSLFDHTSGLSHNSVYDFAQSPHGDIWVLDLDGIHVVTQDQLPLEGMPIFSSYTVNDVLPSYPRQIEFDDLGRLWLATRDGLYFTVTAPEPQDLVLQPIAGIPDAFSLEAVQEGRIFIGTRNGLIYGNVQTEPTEAPEFQTFTQEDGLPHNSITSVLRRGASVWVGTQNGLARFIP